MLKTALVFRRPITIRRVELFPGQKNARTFAGASFRWYGRESVQGGVLYHMDMSAAGDATIDKLQKFETIYFPTLEITKSEKTPV